jgi:3-oxoacyl-(acyl-carrier-protein) synthase
LDAAGAEPSGVQLWLPSANGIVDMDRAEAAVMSEIFGNDVPRAILVKQAIGEMAAAGGAQIVAACRALADPFPADARPRRVLVNSFGAGGNFFAALFESPE